MSLLRVVLQLDVLKGCVYACIYMPYGYTRVISNYSMLPVTTLYILNGITFTIV